MFVSFLIPSLYSQGAEYVTAAMARGFANLGHKVDVVVTADQAELESSIKDRKPFELGERVRLVRLPHHRARWNFIALMRYIIVARPQVVICNAEPFKPVLAFVLLLIPRRIRPKIVHVEHLGGIGLDCNGNVVHTQSSLRNRVLNWLTNRYHAIFVVSKGTGDAVHRTTGYPKSRIFTVYNPAIDDITLKKLKSLPAHPWLRDKICPTFVAAGAFCNAKNHLLLINAFAQVREINECRLIIFGDGDLRSRYLKQIEKLGIKESVSLPGYTDNLPAEIQAADAFVCSSNIESFSIVIVEAMAAHTPVVSTDAPYGPPELLEGGKYGTIVKRCDADALAGGLINVLKGKAIVAPKEAYQKYTLRNVVGLYERALQQIMSEMEV